ncbi:hypothetical protein KAJ61_00730 [Candidatus Parcubacteria bacterium]|nr:hypothetical protein [Candidatus Parcubacteria bacterium]
MEFQFVESHVINNGDYALNVPSYFYKNGASNQGAFQLILKFDKNAEQTIVF